jgi:hypothetical protein
LHVLWLWVSLSMLTLLVVSLCRWHVLKSNSVVGVNRGETGLSIVGVVNLFILSVVNHCTVLMVIFRGTIAPLARKLEFGNFVVAVIVVVAVVDEGLVLVIESSPSLLLLCSLCRFPLSMFLLLVVVAPRKLCLSYVEPCSDKYLGESLRHSVLGDLLGKGQSFGRVNGRGARQVSCLVCEETPEESLPMTS